MSDQVKQQVIVEFAGILSASLEKAFKAVMGDFKALAAAQKATNEEMAKGTKVANAHAAAQGKIGTETSKVSDSYQKWKKAMKELSLDYTKEGAGLRSVSSAMKYYAAGVMKGNATIDVARKQTKDYLTALMGTNSVLVASNKSYGEWAKTVSFKTLKDAEHNKQIQMTRQGIQLMTADAYKAIGLTKEQARVIQSAGMSQDLYSRKLKEAQLIGGDYLKSFQKLSGSMGTSSKDVAIWGRALDQADKGLNNLRLRAANSDKDIGKVALGVGRAAVANAILNDNLKVSGNSFKVFNDAGLKALGITVEQAAKMKMLSSSYGSYGATLQKMTTSNDANLKSFVSLTKTYGTGEASVKRINKALLETDNIIASKVAVQQNRLNAAVTAGTMTQQQADRALRQYKDGLDKVGIASGIIGKQQEAIAYGTRKFTSEMAKAAQYGEKYRDALNFGSVKFGGWNSKEFKDYAAALNLTERAIIKTGAAMNASGKNGDAFVASANRAKMATEVMNRRLDVLHGTLGNSYKYLQPVAEQSNNLAAILDKLGTSMLNVAKYAVGAFAFYGAMNIIGTVTQQILSFDQSLKDLQAITTATDHQVFLFGETIKNVSRETKFSASEIAEGMKNLGQAGFSAAETMVVIGEAATLATGTLSDMTWVVDLMTSTIRAFHLEASESGRLTDLFANAINRSKLTVDKLRVAMNYLASVADKANLSVDDSVTLMGMLANAGVRASTIGTSLRQVVEGLVSPNKAFRDAVEAAGYSVEQFVVDAANPLEDVIRRLQKVVPDAAAAFDLFGIRGAPAISAITSHGVEGFLKMRESMQEAGSAAKMAEIQMEGLANKAKNMKDRFELAAIALGDAGLKYFFEALIDLGREFATMLEGVLSSALGVTVLSVGGLALAISAVNLGIKMFMGLAWVQSLKAAGAAAVAASGGVGILAGALNVLKAVALSLVTTPAGLIALGVAATAAAVSFSRTAKEQRNFLAQAEKSKSAIEQEIKVNDKKKNAANALISILKDNTKTETQRAVALERLVSLGVEVTGVIRDETGAITNLDEVIKNTVPTVKAYIDELDRLAERKRAEQMAIDVEAFLKAEEAFSDALQERKRIEDTKVTITMDFAMTGGDPEHYFQAAEDKVVELENQVESTGQKLNEVLGFWTSLDDKAYTMMLTRAGMGKADAEAAAKNFDKLDSHFFKLWINQLNNLKNFSAKSMEAFDELSRRMDNMRTEYENSPETQLKKIQQNSQTAINALKKTLPDLQKAGEPKTKEFFQSYLDATKNVSGKVKEITDKASKDISALTGLGEKTITEEIEAQAGANEAFNKETLDNTEKAVGEIIKFYGLETAAHKIELDNRINALKINQAQKIGNEHDTSNAILAVQKQQVAAEIALKQKSLALMKETGSTDIQGMIAIQNEINNLMVDMASMRAEEIKNVEAKAQEERERAEQVRAFDHNMRLAEIDATYWEDKNLKERNTRTAVIANLDNEISILEAYKNEKIRKGQEIFDEEQKLRDLTLEKTKELYAQQTAAKQAQKELEKALETATIDNLSSEADRTDNFELQMTALQMKQAQERQQWKEHYEHLLADKTLYNSLMNQLDIKHQREKDDLLRKQQALEYTKRAEFFGELSGMMGEFYAISGQKAIAFFYAQKALAIAEILMNTHAGAAKAFGQFGPFGIPMATLITAMGYAKAGMVAGLTVAQGVKGFADGGEIGGYSPNDRADNVPIMATAGEFMHPVPTVDYYGKGVMEAIRTRSIPRDVLSSYAKSSSKSGGTRFADGGGVEVPSGSSDKDKGAQNLQIVNVLDPGMFDQYMASHAGQKTLMNVISRNPQVIKNIVRN